MLKPARDMWLERICTNFGQKFPHLQLNAEKSHIRAIAGHYKRCGSFAIPWKTQLNPFRQYKPLDAEVTEVYHGLLDRPGRPKLVLAPMCIRVVKQADTRGRGTQGPGRSPDRVRH